MEECHPLLSNTHKSRVNTHRSSAFLIEIEIITLGPVLLKRAAPFALARQVYTFTVVLSTNLYGSCRNFDASIKLHKIFWKINKIVKSSKIIDAIMY